ncbi:hypothetical protein, partial [uncultured Acinetobacter sp.]|uniref:hypothetical protein n=1 Tax=uncultured Acinetobacter sp. TaxID=165433 RepID=UPI00261E9613
MTTIHPIQHSIQAATHGITLAELLTRHPEIARRTAQRLIQHMISVGQIHARGEGRARRYFPVLTINQPADAGISPKIQLNQTTTTDRFPSFIPVSADSMDILSYIDQPYAARTPVGYQAEFLESYQPNQTYYLSEPLRRQLHKIGSTSATQLAAGTYSRA